MNDVDQLNSSLQYHDNHISQPMIENKKQTQRMINKSKARIHMLDDTEEYIDLKVYKNFNCFILNKIFFSRKMIRVKCYIFVYVIICV